MSDSLTATLSVPTDAEGFLSFRCPLCSGDFRLNVDAWRSFTGTTFSCPQCGLDSDRSSIWPREVIAAARAKLLNLVGVHLNETIGGMARRMSGGIVKVTYKGFTRHRVPQITTVPELVETSLDCCGERLKVPLHVAASIFYCPYCGRTQY